MSTTALGRLTCHHTGRSGAAGDEIADADKVRGFARFVGGYYMFQQYLAPDSWRALFGYGAGILLMVPLFVMMILPFLNGSFDSANLTNKLGDSGLAWGGLQIALVWLWLMCWSAWGVDVCATFAPEYKDTVRDTRMALRSAALCPGWRLRQRARRYRLCSLVASIL